MDLSIAAGAPIKVRGISTADGKPTRDMTFGRLTMADLAELQGQMPGNALYVTIYQLAGFAESVTGSEQVLMLSLRRSDKPDTLEDVRKIGSIVDRVDIAKALVGHALTTGEDEVLGREASGK